MSLVSAARIVQTFGDGKLTHRISELEKCFCGQSNKSCGRLCKSEKVDFELIRAASQLKNLAAQINVVIHAVGILATLPRILTKGEQVQYLSLGAGNSGRKFDLETNFRIAEFKFISWKGRANAIRENSLFKDFFGLAEARSGKKKYLYVLGTVHPLKFLNGSRALKSVMSKDSTVSGNFLKQYGNKFSRVCDYYRFRKSKVQIIDVGLLVPEFKELA